MLQQVKDVTLYYEKSGQGTPILLLHGNGESHRIFNRLAEKLSEKYTVYSVDSRGHGQSSKANTLNYIEMAEDIAGFINVLQIDKPILYGFSDGGILGLILASRYPELLSKLIVSGANTKPDGLKKKYIRLFRLIFYITRSSKYKLMLSQPDISDEELSKITVKTLVLAGSNDMIEEEHTRYIAASIKNSSLTILEGETHESYVTDSNKLYQIIIAFLNRQ